MCCSTVSQCTADGTCNNSNDGYAFHMTKKQDHLDHPYDTGKDNLYAISKHTTNLIQCRVTVNKQDADTSATVYVGESDKKGDGNGKLDKAGDSFTVTGLPKTLTIYKGTDDKKNPVTFSYADDPVFAWNADTKGTSKQYQSDKSYCKLSDDGKKRVTDCYFPCEAAS